MSRVRLGDCRYSCSSHLFDAEFLHTLQIALQSDWKQRLSSLAYHEGERPLAQFESKRIIRARVDDVHSNRMAAAPTTCLLVNAKLYKWIFTFPISLTGNWPVTQFCTSRHSC